MNTQTLAADIAARVPAMNQDSPLNNSGLIKGLIEREMNEPNINADHAKMVARLAKSGADIVRQLTPEKADLWHMATGVSGEAGELLDAVKKVVAYNGPMDLANVIEELGDLEFYMEGIRRNLGIYREETLDANMKKLAQRYKDHTYSDEQAHLRRDKQ